MKRIIFLTAFILCLASCSSSDSNWIYRKYNKDTDYLLVCNDDDYYTYIDIKKGDIAKNASYYDRASEFYDGVAIIRQEGKYHFIDKSFEPINSSEYVDVTLFSNGLAWAVEEFGKITAINKKGEEVFTFDEAEQAWPFRENVAVFKNHEGKFGVIGSDGKIRVNPEYDEISQQAYHGLLTAKLDGKEGIIDVNGKQIIPFEYINVNLEMNTKLLGYLVAADEESSKVIGLDNKVVYSSNDDREILVDSDGMILFVNRYAGWKNRKGNTIIPEKFVGALPFYNKDVAIVSLNEREFQLIDKKGNFISDQIPFKYFAPDYFDENDLLIVKNTTCGAINTKGKTVIQDNYPNGLIHIGGGLYAGKTSSSIQIVNSKGKVVNEITGNYYLNDWDYPDDYDDYDGYVENRFVDIEGMISTISSIIEKNVVNAYATPGMIKKQYDLPELNQPIDKGEGPNFTYEFKVNTRKDYYSRSSSIYNYYLNLDLKGAASRDYNTKKKIYDAIKAFYSGNDNSSQIVVPAFSNFDVTFSRGNFTFSPKDLSWICGTWQAGLEEGYVFMSLDPDSDILVDDDLSYDNLGETKQYTIQDNTIKTTSGSDYYTINCEDKTIYYNGTTPMKKTSNIPYNIEHPYTSIN